MLDLPQVDTIAADTARTFLPQGALVSVHSRPYDMPDGQDTLLVHMVVRDEMMTLITDEQAADTIVGLQRELLARGEERFAAIAWATDREVARQAAANGGA